MKFAPSMIHRPHMFPHPDRGNCCIVTGQKIAKYSIMTWQNGWKTLFTVDNSESYRSKPLLGMGG
jgi:hypothetical protein